ncbi:MAG: 50S ribosomal protein L35 [Simkania negevensis]|nr:50S ribosomal protein L35 [Simkania negevensis]
MPKLKTRKAIKSRFKITAKGKLMRSKQGRRHMLTKKSPKRKRHLKKQTLVPKNYEKVYKHLACV